MPQNGIISHIITYDIIYHENPDLSTSFSIFLPFFYLFRHLSETVRRKRRFLCILRGVRRDIYPARVQTFRSRTENRMSGLSDHRKSRFKYSRQTKQKARSLSRQHTNSTMPAPKLEYPVSATPTAFASRIGQFPPLYAGVQAMRARICSVFSCDMFARVVV